MQVYRYGTPNDIITNTKGMASIEMTHECVLIGSEKNIFSIAADFANENFPVYEVKGPNENDGVYDVNYEARKAAYNAYIKGATDNN